MLRLLLFLLIIQSLSLILITGFYLSKIRKGEEEAGRGRKPPSGEDVIQISGYLDVAGDESPFFLLRDAFPWLFQRFSPSLGTSPLRFSGEWPIDFHFCWSLNSSLGLFHQTISDSYSLCMCVSQSLALSFFSTGCTHVPANSENADPSQHSQLSFVSSSKQPATLPIHLQNFLVEVRHQPARHLNTRHSHCCLSGAVEVTLPDERGLTTSFSGVKALVYNIPLDFLSGGARAGEGIDSSFRVFWNHILSQSKSMHL